MDSRLRGNDGWGRSGLRRADYHSRLRGNDINCLFFGHSREGGNPFGRSEHECAGRHRSRGGVGVGGRGSNDHRRIRRVRGFRRRRLGRGWRYPHHPSRSCHGCPRHGRSARGSTACSMARAMRRPAACSGGTESPVRSGPGTAGHHEAPSSPPPLPSNRVLREPMSAHARDARPDGPRYDDARSRRATAACVWRDVSGCVEAQTKDERRPVLPRVPATYPADSSPERGPRTSPRPCHAGPWSGWRGVGGGVPQAGCDLLLEKVVRHADAEIRSSPPI